MDESMPARFQRWRLLELIRRYPGLRITPTYGASLLLAGEIDFRVEGPNGRTIEDTYQLEIRVPADFPRSLPSVRETAARVPSTYHKLEDGALCLAAPTALRIALSLSPSLLTYCEQFVIPYLYGYSCYEQDGTYPYGELAHGDEGILQYLAALFHSPALVDAHRFIELASLKKRSANKLPCPCGSGKRLGRCHNRSVNGFRKRLGRTWCRDEYARLKKNLVSTDRGDRRLKRAG